MRCQTIQAGSVSWIALVACVAFSYSALADETAPRDNDASRPPSRKAILERAGLWPLPEARPSVRAVVDHRRNHSGYSVTNVAIETAPDCYCTGNLYQPLLRHDLGPALLVVDDVKASRRYSAERQILCAHLARLGVTVLACNTSWADPPTREVEPQEPRSLHIWNTLRAVDFLVGLERIDIKRIGLVALDGRRIRQIDGRIMIAIKMPYDFSPDAREAIYTRLGQEFRLKRS
jgi:hypothetical protein